MQHNFQVTDRNKRGLAEQEVHCIIKWLWWNLISGITYQKNILHCACMLLLNRSEYDIYTVCFLLKGNGGTFHSFE